MALAQETRVIGDYTYRVTQLTTTAGQEVLVRLTKMAGPSGASFIEGLAGAATIDIEAALASGLAEAVREASLRLSAEDLKFVTTAMSKVTEVLIEDRAPQLSVLYEQHFAGRYDEWVAWLAFALEVNFKSFFAGSGGLLGKLGRILSKLGLASTSPNTSLTNGPSTASQPVSTTTPV